MILRAERVANLHYHRLEKKNQKRRNLSLAYNPHSLVWHACLGQGSGFRVKGHRRRRLVEHRQKSRVESSLNRMSHSHTETDVQRIQ